MFDPTHFAGGGGGYSRCCCCGKPILDERQSVRVSFNNDPDGTQGLSGLYHEPCSKPFRAFAQVMNVDWYGRF